MTTASLLSNTRVIVIDDMAEIHEDFDKILGDSSRSSADDDLDAKEADLFGDAPAAPSAEENHFELTHAYQGEEGVQLIRKASDEGRPFAMAFVDMRMPPGIDGLETIQKIWANNADTEVVICSAYSDYSWEETRARLGPTDRLLILKKPFDVDEVRQLAAALTRKWQRQQETVAKIKQVNKVVESQTADLKVAMAEMHNMVQSLDEVRATAELTNRSRSEFLNQIGHDIRTPVSGVVGLSNLLLDTELSSQQRQFAQLILSCSTEILRVTNEVIDYCSIDSGQLQVELIPSELRSVMRDVNQSIAPALVEHPAKLDITVDDEVPNNLLTDSARIRQVLCTTLHNLHKVDAFSPLSIHVGLAKLAASSATLEFLVSLHGKNIDMQRVKHLFSGTSTSSDKARSRDKEQHVDNELGLNINKEIVRLLGGDLSIGSSSQRGISVRITLTAEVLPGEARDYTADNGKGPLLFDADVLVIDSHPVNQIVIGQMLRRLGCRPTIAETSGQALTALKRPDYQVVLVNVQAMNAETSRAIEKRRTQEKSSGIEHAPLIAMASPEHSLQACKDRGLDDRLETPLNLRDIQTILAKWLVSSTNKGSTRAAS